RHARLAGQSTGSEQGRGALVGVRGRREGAKAGRRLGLRAIAGEMQLRDRRDRLRLSIESRLVGARLAAHVGDVLDGLGDFPALAAADGDGLAAVEGGAMERTRRVLVA